MVTLCNPVTSVSSTAGHQAQATLNRVSLATGPSVKTAGVSVRDNAGRMQG